MFNLELKLTNIKNFLYFSISYIWNCCKYSELFVSREAKKQAYETIKNFLICTEELSLNYMSQFFYGECIKLNLKLGVITLNSVTEKQNIFDQEFSLPVSPLYQNV